LLLARDSLMPIKPNKNPRTFRQRGENHCLV
jgi:hypothetical protein